MGSDSGIAAVRRVADEALGLMAVLDIPPTPENFAVWYAYADRADPHLRRTIDILMDNGQEFDAPRNAELYAQFVMPTHQSDMVDTVANGLHEVAGRLTTTVREAGDGVSRYGDALSSATDTLTRTAAGELPVRTLVDGLMRETRQMEARNAKLRERLERSSGEIARLRESLEETRREASTDGLTGIANRKRFEQALRSAAASAMEKGGSLCLLMADIDHFKRFNDTHGHTVGDQVLRLVARVLADSIRSNDLAARYGGEEFAVVLPDCTIERAAEIAELIRHTIGQKHIVRRNSGRDLGTVTLSIGVANYRFGEPIGQMVERADSGLYRAKQAGRNRVVLVEEPGSAEALAVIV